MQMTDQEIFDTVAKALLKQGRPSVDPEIFECRYRYYLDKDTRLSCAAGYLIPDNAYRRSFEGTAAEDVDWFYNHFSQDQVALIEALQRAHDFSGQPDRIRLLKNPDLWIQEWKIQMLAIAEKYRLSTKVFDEAEVTD